MQKAVEAVFFTLFFVSALATLVGVYFGGSQFMFMLEYANGAPQQAAGAAMAVAYVVIPYVVAKVFWMTTQLIKVED